MTDLATTNAEPPAPKHLKVIACEIAFREICHLAGECPNILDIDFLTQGYHDQPAAGCVELRKRIKAVPAGKYDAIVLVYGLCSNILGGLRAIHTPLVIPRAHDCITLFLGSKERYQECFTNKPGTYYYTSGWLEASRRRGEKSLSEGSLFVPATLKEASQAIRQKWVDKYGEEQADYLMEMMGSWASTYQRAALIDFDFTGPLNLEARVKAICAQQDWDYEQIPGDLSLLRRLLAGDWAPEDFLIVQPNEAIAPSYDAGVIRSRPLKS